MRRLIMATILALTIAANLGVPPADAAFWSAGAQANQAVPAYGEKWIEVVLSQQLLLAHEGERVVYRTLVSTGTASHPTVRGTFRIYVKYRRALMQGPGYYLPNVPYVMYFYRGYGLHGTYWHNNFGHPMSHGCVNLKTAAAAWLYNWAPVGTRVVVRR
jgi:lipoprotein-anchoring transpeptidase ErfK/SrfK